MRPDPHFRRPAGRAPVLLATLLALGTTAGCAAGRTDAAAPTAASTLRSASIAGEVTQTSAILQVRLGTTDTLVAGDIPGLAARGVLEIATDSAFARPLRTAWLRASAENDYMLRARVTGLAPATRYFYRARAGSDTLRTQTGSIATFRTLPAPSSSDPVTFTMISCMHYEAFYGLHKVSAANAAPATGEDRRLGYPGFQVIQARRPDFVISNGDNVYYDHPDDSPARTQEELRAKWHRQFWMPRMRETTARFPFYFLKDDHDYRFNDADTTGAKQPSHALGIATFREQVPVADPADPAAVTYRTHRLNRAVQLWFLEGRDYRSPNSAAPGPAKTLWGREQREWLQRTLLESDADFKVIVSPTPLVGPDDAYKRDNHVGPGGFRSEGESFMAWLAESKLTDRVFILNGDRHWQYHSIHPSGLEEFGSGAFVVQNARPGRDPGDPASTDPQALIRQPFSQADPVGGMLEVHVEPGREGAGASILFSYYDEQGKLLYAARRYSRRGP